MLNQKKQIVLLEKVVNFKNFTVFDLPGYPTNFYLQTVDTQDQSLEFFNFIFEKPISKSPNKKFISKHFKKKFRYTILNNIFKQYTFFKFFSKKINKTKNLTKIKSFVLLLKLFSKQKEYPLAFQKIKRGGFTTMISGFKSFMPKSLSLKVGSQFSKQYVNRIKYLRLRRKHKFFCIYSRKFNIIATTVLKKKR